ncbi:hypothetical protein [Pseudobutyrivibrio sp.]|uniref:hypothetical protein n=1 Tax=Pseudobutyrivibrio sp. TaxID=2014367 RepID=UPI001D5AEC14|nr:hypothetical protein [Pseudobutyrivibrio sp.]MBE5910714.1 hypothetical protein [Pseudobutyrivibrio sp.]
MDTVNMLINVAAIVSGLFIYIFICKTRWGKEHEQIQYAIMLMAILFAVLVGGLIRWLLK